jgi:hypothetical protein
MPARRSRNVTPKPAPVEEPAEVVEESVVSESTSTRRKVSRETILEEFDSLMVASVRPLIYVVHSRTL